MVKVTFTINNKKVPAGQFASAFRKEAEAAVVSEFKKNIPREVGRVRCP